MVDLTDEKRRLISTLTGCVLVVSLGWARVVFGSEGQTNASQSAESTTHVGSEETKANSDTPQVTNVKKVPDTASMPQGELSVLGGIAHRSTRASDNPDGIAYGAGFEVTVEARGYAWSWLSGSLYHRRGYHHLNLPYGAASIDYQRFETSTLLAYSLGARLEPTWPVTDSLRLWLAMGLGWGRLNVGRIVVHETKHNYRLRERSGVFVEIPLSLGVSYTIIPRWLALQAETGISPLIMQTGALYGSSPYTDNEGTLKYVGPFPTQSYVFNFAFGVSLVL